MRARSLIWGLLCLLCLAGVWFLWHQKNGRDGSPGRPRQAVAPAVRPHLPSSVASRGTISTNAMQISRAEWGTNKFAGRLSNTTRTIGQLVHDGHAILLANALIDTTEPYNFVFPKNLQSQGDPGAYIVQARGPIDSAFRQMLAQMGATIVSYIPNDAYLVRASASVANALEASALAQSVVPYEPYYKLQTSLLYPAANQLPLPDNTALNLGLFADNAPATVQQIEKLGGQVIGNDQSPFGPVVRVIPPKNWTTLATLSGVQIVERFHPRTVANDLSRASVGVAADSLTATNYLGLTGANIIVEVNDTGIDAQHPDLSGGGFYNKPTPGVIGDAPQSLVDTNGHGTHVAGIIAGDGLKSPTVTNAPGSILVGGIGSAGQFRGMAPGATLYSVGGVAGGSDTNVISDYYFQAAPAQTNALISNNSWVYDGDNEYDLAAASYDAATRDALPFITGSQPVLFVFAAANDGNGDDTSDPGSGVADSLESPATAKDVISVGAIQEERNITNAVTTITLNSDGTTTTNTSQPWQAETSTDSRVAGFSARGNVGIGIEGTFGRFKPDVVAPGTFIISTRSEQWDIGTYFYQDPTNSLVQPFSGLVVQPGSAFVSSFPNVPTNAVEADIYVFPNADSPFPFPGLPIFVGLFSSAGYDFFTTNDEVLIPGSPEAPANYLQQIIATEGLDPFLGGFNFAVSNNTANPISFDLETVLLTTNGTGNYFIVLSNLDNSIGTFNGGSTGPGPYYRYESGTSMSAADVSGVLALMQEFYVNAYHTNPSPAMLKAMLINGGQVSSTAYNYQVQNSINYEGWGLVNLPDSLPAGITNQLGVSCSTYVQDQSPTNALATGDSRTYFVNMSSPAPLRVTLAWTDPPGDPAAAIKLVNNLVLVVTNMSDPANPIVYYGNDIPAGTYNNPHATNTPTVFDSINNIQTVNLQQGSGTNYSVTVMGYRVNVNAVTAQTNNVVQDYALVISSGTTNDMTVSSTPASFVSNPTGDQQITYIDQNDEVLLNQLVGANTPLLGTNTIPFSSATAPVEGFSGTWQVTAGMTNQWQFYVVTNISGFSNAAFVTFNPNAPEPDTLSVPRMGVFSDTTVNASRDADIDLYVSTDPTLTNLNPVAISNAVVLGQVGGPPVQVLPGLSFAGASLGRGSSEFVADTNAWSRAAPKVYYIGVKSEDQMSAEYGFISIFTQTPFSQMQNGNQVVNGVPVPTYIPDGSAKIPGKGYLFGIALYPMEVAQVTVTNNILHQNFGDLIGTLTLNGNHADVLNNHDSFPNPNLPGLGDYGLYYDDSVGGGAPGSRPSDGPGTLNNYIGQQALGVWMLTEADNALTQTGYVYSYTLTISPHQSPTTGVVTNFVPGGSWVYDYIDVPPGATNLTLYATNLTDTANPPAELFVKFGSEPTTNDFDQMVMLNPNGMISIGPPLVSGRYYIGLLNPNPNSATQEITLYATIGIPSIPGQTIFNSGDTPIPIPDDAVTYDSIYLPANQIISSLDVAIAVQHPRISDLVFHLIGPDGTRTLLMENRGGTDPNGAGGIASVTTNTVLASDFGTATAGDYPVTSPVQGWEVANGQVSVETDPANAYPGKNKYLALASGTLDFQLTTTPGATYTMSFTCRGPGIVGWWRGENNALDSSGNNNTGILQNGATYTNGEVGQAFYVNGVNADVEAPASPSLNVGFGSGFTIEGWIDPSVLNTERVIAEWDNGTTWGLHFNVSTAPGVGPYGTGTGCLYGNIIDPTGGNHWLSTAANVVQPNVFQHAVLTYDKNSGVARIYLNGNLMPLVYETGVTAGLTAQTTYNLYLGRRIINPNQASQWAGLDELSVYNRALSYSEIQAIYNDSTNGKFDPIEFPISQPQSLAEVQVSAGNVTTNLFGSNTNWQTQTFTFTATGGSTLVQIKGIEPGMLVGNVSIAQTPATNFSYLVFTENTNLTTTPIKFAVPPFVPTGPTVITNVYFGLTNVVTNTDLYYLPEQSLDAYDGMDAQGPWTLEILDDRAGATNPPPLLLNWQLRFNFVTGGGIPSGTTETNIIPPNGWTYYQINVPTNVDYATNILVSATGPVDVWFNPANNPIGTSPPDSHLMGNATSGTSVLSTFSTPTNIVPGGVYYIGIYNPNTYTVTNAYQVDFHYFQTIPVTPGVPFGGTVAGDISGDGVDHYSIVVPTNADYATNLLISSTEPVNVWFNQTNNPVCLTPPDYLLITNATNGISILNATSAPPLMPGLTYYLAVQNTNASNATYSMEVNFHLANILTNGVPTTNSVPTNSFAYFEIQVPTNADYATNLLLSASLPVNVWFNQNASPTGANPGDYLLIPNATNGVSVLSASSVPPLVPGKTYYLGVQNTNNVPVTFSLQVDFHFVIPPSITGPTITAANVNGTNGFLLQWSGPMNYQYFIQWKTNLSPVVPWNTVLNPIINVTYTPTDGDYSWFDDGSLTGGFAPQKFYRVIASLLSGPITTNSGPVTNVIVPGSITPLTVTVPANAVAASNVLVSATGPISVYFSQTTPFAGGTNAGDVLVLSNVTSGSFLLTSSSMPPLVPGANYYLGLQNTGPTGVSFVFAVNFAYGSLTNPTPISGITFTNIGGTNGILLTWYAQTNYQFQIQWTTALATSPISWTTIPGVVLTNLPTFTPTNGIGEFQYFDNGSLTGGFGTQKFYRLIAYPPGTTIPPALVITSIKPVAGGVQIQWNGSTNYVYDVAWTTNLALPSAGWNVISNLMPPTLIFSGGVFTFTDTNVLTPEFFRVLLLP